MIVVLQRCSYASVSVADRLVNQIDNGICLLCGLVKSDQEADLNYLAHKITHLRIFADSLGKLNLDIKQANGEVLAISQFTLCADTHKGHRPSFSSAMPPDLAQKMFGLFVQKLRNYSLTVKEGMFGATMEVCIHNDGPVTIILDSRYAKPLDKLPL